MFQAACRKHRVRWGPNYMGVRFGGVARGVGWRHRGIPPLTPDRRSLAITIRPG
jgi:hypothetical protein